MSETPSTTNTLVKINTPFSSHEGLPSSRDIHNCAVNYLATMQKEFPAILFPSWFYKYEKIAAVVNPAKVHKHFMDLVKECERRITHPNEFSKVGPTIPTELIWPITPFNGIANKSLPVFNTPPIVAPPRSESSDDIKSPSPIKAIALEEIKIFNEPVKISPTEPEEPPVDPSPIRINMNSYDQMTMIPPPYGEHGLHAHVGSYHWIFAGFTLLHLLAETRAGFPLFSLFSNRLLRHILLDLEGFQVAVKTILDSNYVCRDYDPRYTYGAIMTEFVMNDLDDSMAYMDMEDTTFHSLLRSDLFKITIDLDEIVQGIKRLLTNTSPERNAGYNCMAVRAHVDRIMAFKL